LPPSRYFTGNTRAGNKNPLLEAITRFAALIAAIRLSEPYRLHLRYRLIRRNLRLREFACFAFFLDAAVSLERGQFSVKTARDS
jgi:hypothetical protein